MSRKFVAEMLGTAVLVLIGCGAAVFGGDHIGQTGISLAFGFAIVAMAYGVGPISGCHINPAVSLAALIVGRMSIREMLTYWGAQFLGALVGAALVALIAGSFSNIGQNGWGVGYLGEYSVGSALMFELVFTAIFVVVILGVTGVNGASRFAGLAIGLTLAGIHLVGIQITGVSVNPARSFGPAVLVGGTAIAQLWLFIVAPFVGAALGALLFRIKVLED